LPTAICTISTSSHLFKVQALYDSIRTHSNVDFYCLLTDRINNTPFPFKVDNLNVLEGELAQKLKKKYTGNKLRWACKSLYLDHLLSSGYDKVIYVDNDIFFHGPFDFLFDKLNTSSVLLTPHHYPTDPTRDQNWLEANYKVGLFNAGFIGVNSLAKPMLEWWGNCCLYNIKKSYWRGLFDDQKYLDLVPVLFENVEILNHKGCNIAGWNIINSQRSVSQNKEVIIDNIWPIIFIHYNYYTIKLILDKQDPHLFSYWTFYLNELKRIHPLYDPRSEKPSLSYNLSQYFQYIRYRVAKLADKK
jgi:hypothetical protein